jgi:hypothetical protein
MRWRFCLLLARYRTARYFNRLKTTGENPSRELPTRIGDACFERYKV